jgi:hypothetical protein
MTETRRPNSDRRPVCSAAGCERRADIVFSAANVMLCSWHALKHYRAERRKPDDRGR